MFHSFRIDWHYPSEGRAPPSPVMVNTTGAYFGGRPTPPSSPPIGSRATVDDDAPCPPTPTCVPSDVDQDQSEWSNASDSHEPNDYGCTSELDGSTVFADPLTDDISNESDNALVADREPRSVLDVILYAYETYARPSPVLLMMERATLDGNGLDTHPVNPFACTEPLRLFSLTGGHTPLTGLYEHDLQSLLYYDKHPHPSPLRQPETCFSYRYSVSAIETLQHSLRTVWSSVYPPPIPPVIVRSRDLIGPSALSRRLDGFAFVVPTEDSIWGIIRQRGVDLDFRPMDPSLTVETCLCTKGAALYLPQHIVAPKFAVNVFVELADSVTSANPLCEYLGAYILQAMDGMGINRAVWADIDPEIQQAVYGRAPECFRIYDHPSFGWPQLPYVRFRYYKWDRNIVGLADEIYAQIQTASQDVAQCKAEDESDDSDDDSDDTDSDFDIVDHCECDDCNVDQDTAFTVSAYSPTREQAFFMDVWPSA